MSTAFLPSLAVLHSVALSVAAFLGILVSGFAQTAGSSYSSIPFPNDGARLIVEGLKVQLDSTRSYDPAYVRIDYPGGDVPLSTGVCADVIVRAFRHAGIDLQVEINRDMKGNFRAYPQLWGLSRPDRNIDHRRVANQMRFLERKKKSVEAVNDSSTFLPGDVVAWMLPGNLYHIGVVTNIRSPHTGRPVIAHNIGAGAQLHDCLFAWEIIGHYRWFE